MSGFLREELSDELPAVVRKDPTTGEPIVIVDSRLPIEEAAAAARAAWKAYHSNSRRLGGALLPVGIAAPWDLTRGLRNATRAQVVTATATVATVATVGGIVIAQLEGQNDNSSPSRPVASPTAPALAQPAPPRPSKPAPTKGRPRPHPDLSSENIPPPGQPVTLSRAPMRPWRLVRDVPKMVGVRIPSPPVTPTPAEPQIPVQPPASACVAEVRLRHLADVRVLCNQRLITVR